MSKENLIPVSTRLDPKTIEAIDKFVKSRTYWKRNTVINQVLTVVFSKFQDQDIYDMVRYCPKNKEEIIAKFEIIRKSIEK